jgi:tetratricopeptide (TPR) repeat protein
MKKFNCSFPVALLTGLALAVSGCATSGDKHVAQQFDAPSKEVAATDKGLFEKASKAQKEGRHEAAVTLWKSFLAKNPDSFTGHNNLGMVYYNQDMLSQALEEFEVAYRLQPQDPLIRKNLSRALRFKANMFHENREYFKTLDILKRLEVIVEPEEKQALLFKQEQVCKFR